MRQTWDDISSVHGIFIFNEAKAIHEFDFLDGTSAMGAKVFFNIAFCDWKDENKSQRLVQSGKAVERIQESEYSYPPGMQHSPGRPKQGEWMKMGILFRGRLPR